jgi:hypothetical protein
VSCLALSGYDPSLLEEGMFLHIGERLAAGEVLYRDIVVFTGPLPFEVLGFFYRLLGAQVWVGRVLVSLLTGFATAAAFGLARRSNAGSLAHVAAASVATAPCLLFPLLAFYYYTTIAMHLSIIAGYALVRGMVSTRWAFIAGIVVSAVALCKQTNGVVLAIGLAGALALGCERTRLLRHTGAYVSGGLLSAVLTIGFYGWTGALGDLINAIVVLPLSLDSTFTSPLPNFWPLGELNDDIYARRGFYLPYFFMLLGGFNVHAGPNLKLLTQLAYALPFLTIAFATLRLVVGQMRGQTAIQIALMIAWITNLFPRADWGHLVHVLPVTTIACCVLLGSIPVVKRFLGPRPIGALATLLCIGFLGGGAWAYSTIAAQSTAPLSARVPLKPVTPGLGDGRLASVVEYIRQNTEPGDPIFVPRAEPLLYFATDTRNPTPYPGVIPGMHEEQQDRILSGLTDVRFVVMSEIDQPAMTYYSRELPRVQEYLERHFTVVNELADSNWLAVLERGDDRGRNLFDFIDNVDEARPFVRNAPVEIEDTSGFDLPVASKRNRRVLAFTLGAHGGGLDYDLVVPADAQLSASIGQKMVTGLGRFIVHPDDSRVVFSIRPHGSLAFIGLREISLGRLAADTNWREVLVDLSAYEGQRVTLRLELASSAPLPPGKRLGYFGSPTLRAPASGS